MTAPANFHKWEVDLLRRLDAPATKANIRFLNAWARREGAGGYNNPFNSTQRINGSTSVPGTPGVQNYATPADGAEATYNTLTNGLYPDIVAALRSGKASTTKRYNGLHIWSAGPNGPATAGYYSLAGVPTTPPNTAPGTGTGTAATDQGAGGPSGCQHKISVKASVIPLGSICLDKPIAMAAMAGGGLIMAAGLAVIIIGTIRTTAAGRVASDAIAVIPVARAVKAAKATTPAARAARAETTQAAAARRRAPIERERRAAAREPRARTPRPAVQRVYVMENDPQYATLKARAQGRQRPAHRPSAARPRVSYAPKPGRGPTREQAGTTF